MGHQVFQSVLERVDPEHEHAQTASPAVVSASSTFTLPFGGSHGFDLLRSQSGNMAAHQTHDPANLLKTFRREPAHHDRSSQVTVEENGGERRRMEVR